MTQDDAFLQAILDSPDDDTPRLAYADWLDEHGEADRAEFIRVQVALAALPPDDPRRGQLGDRERQLLAGHREEWLGPLRGVVEKAAFRRGFVESGAASVPSLLRHADAVFLATPLRRLTLSDAAPLMDQLAVFPPSAGGTAAATGSWPREPSGARRC